MTPEDKIDKLTQAAAAALESIQALERIAAVHQRSLEAHDTQIANILTALERLDSDASRTDASIRAMADELINTQREWQAYLRRLPRQ